VLAQYAEKGPCKNNCVCEIYVGKYIPIQLTAGIKE
jgi:hypothetical protein